MQSVLYDLELAAQVTSGRIQTTIVLAAAEIRELTTRLEVAIDWLADKGVPAEHVEMKRMMDAVRKARHGGAV